MPASVVTASHSDAAESPLVAALWAESAQQVFDRGSVRVCHQCALPVSTQARYCRRCGTQQG
jgi:ribosomal protein L40E